MAVELFVSLHSTLSRYHVGESLIPSARHYLRFIDAEKKMINCGFTRKVLTLFSCPFLGQRIKNR